MKTPLAVVIPISKFEHNSENINAILKQSSKFQIEVILVLDNQKNLAFENLTWLITELNLEAKIVKVNSNNPGGARNLGKQLATRKWIAFWDCDDLPLISETIKLIEEAEKSQADIAVGNYEVEDIRTNRVVIQDLNLRSPQIGIGLNPGIWRMIFLKEFLADVEFPELSMGEDQVFLQRAINQECNFIVRNFVVYRYRTGIPSQLTRNIDRSKDIVPAHELAVAEFNPRGKLRKMTMTMLIRQELTILKKSECVPKIQTNLIISLLKKIFLSPEILLEVLIYKLVSLRRKI